VPEIRTTSSTGGQKGTKLARFDLIPVGPLTELAEHFGIGASKYANHQWRQGYEWSKSYAALMRHLTAFWAGYDYDVCSNDPDGCSHVDTEGNPFVAVREDACFNHTGSHHMAAVAWHAFCLLEFKDAHPGHDDRYVSNALESEPELRKIPEEYVDLGYTDLTADWVRDYDTEWLEQAQWARALENFQNETIRFSVPMPSDDFMRVLLGDDTFTSQIVRQARFVAGVDGTHDSEPDGYVGEYRHFLRKRAPQA
jgi:hypothetical protein